MKVKTQNTLLKLVILGTLTTWASLKPYKNLSYRQVVEKIAIATKTYPETIQSFNAAERFKSKLNKNYCDNNREICKHPVVITTNFKSSLEEITRRPTMLLVGSMHGNEIVGTNTITYFIEKLGELRTKNTEVWDLLNKVLIVMIPMANPNGFSGKYREEIRDGAWVDPNRDFPYDPKGGNKCMKTNIARVISEVVKKIISVTAITYHGGDNSITYPWGNYPHEHDREHNCPDFKAFDFVAKNLRLVAGGNFEDFYIQEYNVGTMTDVVYACKGPLEDFMYGGGWDKKNMHLCDTSHQPVPYKKFDQIYPEESLRTLIYLIEAGLSKMPGEGTFGDDADFRDNKGNVNRNLRINTKLGHYTAPSLIIDQVTLEPRPEQKAVMLDLEDFRVRGCDDLDSMKVVYKPDASPTWSGFKEETFKEYGKVVIRDVLKVENLVVYVVVNCKNDFKQPRESQTHFVRMRLRKKYHVENGIFQLNSMKTFAAELDFRPAFKNRAPTPHKKTTLRSSDLGGFIEPSKKLKAYFQALRRTIVYQKSGLDIVVADMANKFHPTKHCYVEEIKAGRGQKSSKMRLKILKFEDLSKFGQVLVELKPTTLNPDPVEAYQYKGELKDSVLYVEVPTRAIFDTAGSVMILRDPNNPKKEIFKGMVMIRKNSEDSLSLKDFPHNLQVRVELPKNGYFEVRINKGREGYYLIWYKTSLKNKGMVYSLEASLSKRSFSLETDEHGEGELELPQQFVETLIPGEEVTLSCSPLDQINQAQARTRSLGSAKLQSAILERIDQLMFPDGKIRLRKRATKMEKKKKNKQKKIITKPNQHKETLPGTKIDTNNGAYKPESDSTSFLLKLLIALIILVGGWKLLQWYVKNNCCLRGGRREVRGESVFKELSMRTRVDRYDVSPERRMNLSDEQDTREYRRQEGSESGSDEGYDVDDLNRGQEVMDTGIGGYEGSRFGDDSDN